jgi:hypothetical protein
MQGACNLLAKVELFLDSLWPPRVARHLKVSHKQAPALTNSPAK